MRCSCGYEYEEGEEIPSWHFKHYATLKPKPIEERLNKNKLDYIERPEVKRRMDSDDAFGLFFILVCVAIVGLLIGSFISQGQMTETGKTFCKEYGLQFEKIDWNEVPGEFRFVCSEDTSDKVDGIGIKAPLKKE